MKCVHNNISKTFVTIIGAVLIALGMVVDVQAESAGFGTFSEGYRMGQLSKFSVKGFMMKSGEGQLLMGREGTPYIKSYSCGNNTCRKTINPWYFSATEAMASSISKYAGEYVVIQYEQAQMKSPAYDTDYMVKRVMPVERKELSRTCIDSKASGSKSEGFRVGRIVKASSKGHLSKTYEVIIQVGNSGNQFKSMSVMSDDMFNCAVEALKGGNKVKVEYSQSFIHNPFGQDTSYNVKSIAPLGDI